MLVFHYCNYFLCSLYVIDDFLLFKTTCVCVCVYISFYLGNLHEQNLAKLLGRDVVAGAIKPTTWETLSQKQQIMLF